MRMNFVRKRTGSTTSVEIPNDILLDETIALDVWLEQKCILLGPGWTYAGSTKVTFGPDYITQFNGELVDGGGPISNPCREVSLKDSLGDYVEFRGEPGYQPLQTLNGIGVAGPSEPRREEPIIPTKINKLIWAVILFCLAGVGFFWFDSWIRG